MLGFSLENGQSGVWVKAYCSGSYPVRVTVGKTLAESTVHYGDKVNIARRTTLNFSQAESRVVFECVDRLLTQGYEPQSLTLEKSYQVGHGDKYLDILVSKGKQAYMMIECKTWGGELENAKVDMLQKGGQLLSYWLQDRDAKILALYASRLHAGETEASYVALETNALAGSNLAEVHESWDKSPFNTGLFDGQPYQPKERRLRVRDLKDMKSEDGGKIFNAFAEVLRRHVISDKPNAFNKIFNLFICKVQDEEKTDPDAFLDFQWLPDEDPEAVLGRLSDLYKKGLNDYLQMAVADHSTEELESHLISLSDGDKAELRRMFIELRLYKNNEFAFLEVYDRKTFLQNAEILKDVVRLLQGKRLRYTHKQPFMGEFFERLLNTSVKQESGQFFTPIPIARFICDSLPIEKIIADKLTRKAPKFLPYLLDYAAGSGHFLTEGMDRIDEVLKTIDITKLDRTQKVNFNAWRENYLWAKEFVYGVEKDYRLAKTAKVSCFLNGDGEANLIRGDGLDHFARSEEYQGILKKAPESTGQDNPVFDVVVANPPYSVWQCKMTVKGGDESFTLWPHFTAKSDDIECLFAERTKQVLRDGGVAGVLFPVSILSNSGIEQKTRDILLKHFDIVGIAILGSMTFMKANVTTATLFMRRRPDAVWKRIDNLIEHFFQTWQDIAINAIPNAVETYAQHVWGLSLADYIAAIKDQDNLTSHSLYTEYQKVFAARADIKAWIKTKQYKAYDHTERNRQFHTRFGKYLVGCEREKLLHFLLAYGQKTVLVNAPSDTDEQKRFLGYEFKERMGYEGLWPVNGDKINSALYDETSRDNPEKIATLIRQNFNGVEIVVPANLKPYVSVGHLTDLLKFRQPEFDLVILTNRNPSVFAPSLPQGNRKIRELIDFIQGVTYSKAQQRVTATNIRILTATHIPLIGDKVITDEPIYLDDSVVLDESKRIRQDDIFLCTNSGSISHLGKSVFIERDLDCYAGGFCALLRQRESGVARFVYALLQTETYKNMMRQRRALGINNFDRNGFLEWVVPFPDEHVRRRILRRLSRIERVEDGRKHRIDELKSAENNAVWTAIQNAPMNKTIGCCFDINPSKREIALLGLKDTDIVTFLPMPAVSDDGSINQRASRLLSEVKKGFTYFRNGDILFAKITPCMENGKGALASDLEKGVGFGSTEFHILRAKGEIDARIMFNFLQQQRFRKLAQPHMKGMAGQQRVSKDYLEKFEITIPSASAQADLVKLIEESKMIIVYHNARLIRLAAIKKDYLLKQLGIE